MKKTVLIAAVSALAGAAVAAAALLGYIILGDDEPEVSGTVDDEPGLIVCSPSTAEDLKKHDDDVSQSLVVSSAIPDGEAIVVTKRDFLDWAYGENDRNESTCACKRDRDGC